MHLHRVRKGLNLPLAGAPAQRIDAAMRASPQVGLLGADSVGLKPAFAVQPGTRVLRGQALYEDRSRPGVHYTSPAAGTLRVVNRGARRAFVSLLVDVAADDAPDTQIAFAPDARRDVRALLLASGLWTALRERPFGRVPAADAQPQALFVTALDTRPHAPDPQVVLAGREADFERGLDALATLGDMPVYLCLAPGSRLAAAGSHPRVQRHVFEGPHPAGMPGLHMHLLHPVGAGRSAWHIAYQDVAALGRLLASGELDVERVVALGGPAMRTPRLVRTRLGASIAALVAGEVAPGEVRVVSGSALDGHSAMDETTAYLGRYHQQVCALHEGREREPLGWIAPQRDKYSIWSVVAGHFATRGLPLTTTTNGGERAMVPIGSFERVMPMDIMATHLLRALVTGDAAKAVALGALELDEEDLALCTFVCPGKTDYAPLLRRVLERVEKEGA